MDPALSLGRKRPGEKIELPLAKKARLDDGTIVQDLCALSLASDLTKELHRVAACVAKLNKDSLQEPLLKDALKILKVRLKRVDQAGDLREKVKGLLEPHSGQSDAITFQFDDGSRSCIRREVLEQSPVLKRMTEGGFRDGGKSKIHIHEDDGAIFRIFAECLHSETVDSSLTAEESVALLYLADKYNVDWLKITCSDMLEEDAFRTEQNLPLFFKAGLDLSINELIEYCADEVVHCVRSDDELTKLLSIVDNTSYKDLQVWCRFMLAADRSIRDLIKLDRKQGIIKIRISIVGDGGDEVAKAMCIKRLCQKPPAPPLDLVLECEASTGKPTASGTALLQDLLTIPGVKHELVVRSHSR